MAGGILVREIRTVWQNRRNEGAKAWFTAQCTIYKYYFCDFTLLDLDVSTGLQAAKDRIPPSGRELSISGKFGKRYPEHLLNAESYQPG